MTLTFKYTLDKDVENFLKGFRSVNSKTPTRLMEQYLEQYAEPNEKDATVFLAAQGFDTDAKLKEISDAWVKIEAPAAARMEEMFGIKIALPTAYLTANARCTYSTEGNYFFVCMASETTNKTICHELLHFYTRHAFYDELEKEGITKEKYNDVKESLTELLNTDFADLLGENADRGYPQHAEMRAEVRRLRGEDKGVGEIVFTLAK